MARKHNLACADNTREKIKVGMLLKRLEDHIVSDTDLMTASQVNAAKILLGKTLPDLRASEITVGAVELTHEEWLSRIRGGDSGSSTDTDQETTPE